MPWWVPAAGWIAAGALAAAGAEWAEDCRILLAFAGLSTIVLLRRVLRQVSGHQRHHRRMDREHGWLAAFARLLFTDDGQDVPAALADEREQQPGVVPFRRPGAAPRHRAQSRRRNA
jgi:hypothetical protein